MIILKQSSLPNVKSVPDSLESYRAAPLKQQELNANGVFETETLGASLWYEALAADFKVAAENAQAVSGVFAKRQG
jgi:hypothetical protein